MKTFADDTGRSDGYTRNGQDTANGSVLNERIQNEKASAGEGKSAQTGKYTRFFPHATLFAMICAILLMDAILPLRNLWFHESTLTQLGSWPVIPSLVLFPGWIVIPPIRQTHVTGIPDILPSWGTLVLLVGAFIIVFLTYIFALRRLPTCISRRFVMISTLILGLLFTTIPIVTSPDLYSYIAYARIGILHGLNPLTTIPRTIQGDVIYKYIEWVDQPSAYGPAWTLLTCFFQWIFVVCGIGNYVLPMVLCLRLWGLMMHLSSVALIWSISGSLQRLHGIASQKKRLHATLAFAWNPLLLLEACTNAHNDTTLLFLLLAAIWFLVRAQLGVHRLRWPCQLTWLSPGIRARIMYLAPTIMLALGTCLKINLILLAPGLFFYQWLQENEYPARRRLKRVGGLVFFYVGLIIGLYAPFWQNGAIFNVFRVNPAAYRSINTLPDTFSHLYNGIVAALGFPLGATIGSPAEHFLHTLSMGIFILCYIGLCWQVFRVPARMRGIHGLVCWLTVTWLFYCGIGSPWFWPWYMVTFFGLYSLVEASKPAQAYLVEQFEQQSRQISVSRLFEQFQAQLLQPRVVRMFTFSMLTLYCFSTWGPQHTFIPFLPGFLCSSLSGIWSWALPFLSFVTPQQRNGILPNTLREMKVRFTRKAQFTFAPGLLALLTWLIVGRIAQPDHATEPFNGAPFVQAAQQSQERSDPGRSAPEGQN